MKNKSFETYAKAINGNAQDIYRCLYEKTKTHKKYHYEVVV